MCTEASDDPLQPLSEVFVQRVCTLSALIAALSKAHTPCWDLMEKDTTVCTLAFPPRSPSRAALPKLLFVEQLNTELLLPTAFASGFKTRNQLILKICPDLVCLVKVLARPVTKCTKYNATHEFTLFPRAISRFWISCLMSSTRASTNHGHGGPQRGSLHAEIPTSPFCAGSGVSTGESRAEASMPAWANELIS